MNKFWMLVLVLVVGYCAVTFANRVPSSVFDPRTQSEVVVNQSEAAVNQSQASLLLAQASQKFQEVRRQNEMDDGIAINVGARTVMGRGITDAEQIGTGLFSVFSCSLLSLGALVVVGILFVMSKLTRTTVTNV